MRSVSVNFLNILFMQGVLKYCKSTLCSRTELFTTKIKTYYEGNNPPHVFTVRYLWYKCEDERILRVKLITPCFTRKCVIWNRVCDGECPAPTSRVARVQGCWVIASGQSAASPRYLNMNDGNVWTHGRSVEQRHPAQRSLRHQVNGTSPVTLEVIHTLADQCDRCIWNNHLHM